MLPMKSLKSFDQNIFYKPQYVGKLLFNFRPKFLKPSANILSDITNLKLNFRKVAMFFFKNK